MRALLLTLITLSATPVALATSVYKWVDENGVVHFSDQPHENAEKVNVREPQTYPGKSGPPATPASAPARPANSPPRTCTIASPGSDQMLMNTDTVPVLVRIDPRPEPDEQIFLLLDGNRVSGLPTSGSQFALTSVDRGTHTVQMVLQGADGRVACQSSSVTFHVHQPSVLNPQNAATRKPH